MTDAELDAMVKALLDEFDDQAADAITALRAELAAERAKVEVMRTALQTLRNLACEAIEDDEGNSGCGQCENDCTGCIAHAAITATREAKP